MEYINQNLLQNLKKPSVIALGNFDGIHLGHRKLIERVKTISKEQDLASVIFSFHPHPSFIINGMEQVKLIFTKEEKLRIMQSFDIDKYIEYPFTDEIVNMSAERFIKDILICQLKAKSVVIGENYGFGYKKEGNPNLLSEYGKRLGFDVDVIKSINFEDEIVSSTRIRKLIKNGEMEKAVKLLTIPYFIMGTVEQGEKVGRKIGFPTINIKSDIHKILPSNGVYVTKTIIDNEEYNSVTNIGYRPTINLQKSINIETNLLDYEENLYDKKVIIQILSKIRDERKFNSLKELTEQIACDVQYAKKYFLIISK